MLGTHEAVPARLALGRLVVAASVLAFLSTLGASCVDLLGLGGYSGAVQSLCDMLAECYGASFYPTCVERAEKRLGEASPEEREAYLTAFADNSCLESCTNARACLDHQPICSVKGGSCGAAEQCCGFTQGASQCDGSSCCVARGAPCSGPGQCCAEECIEGTCGGVQCKNADESCGSSGECCGDLTCSPSDRTCGLCLPDSSECSNPADCCSGSCVFAMEEPVGAGGGPGPPPPVLGYCETPSCGYDGASCTTPADCCDWSPFCVPVPGAAGWSVCSVGDCMPFGSFCQEDDDCCNAYCDPLYGICSFEDDCRIGAPCAGDGDCCEGECPAGTCCLPDGLGCAVASDCCGGVCDPPGFICKGSGCEAEGVACSGDPTVCCSGLCDAADGNTGSCCPVFGNYCGHSVCEQGQPLRPNCGTIVVNGPDFGNAACITAVCDANPACCCTAWDASCVSAVSELCSTNCVIPL